MADLLLASGSSRRRELLEQIGVPYHSASMDIDESVLEGELPDAYVRRLAKEKALAGLSFNPEKTVLAADTTVTINGTILGKPDNERVAFEMLKRLSGTNHLVLTGIAVAKLSEGKAVIEADVVTTEVSFMKLSDQQIRQYIATGEPMDKAGAYGIQGKAALFVEGIVGSYSNVVGLPLAETGKILQAFDVPIWQE
ncbi:hypothetical protein A3752_03750 [Oleiphilus sp. HI0081]|uniref:Maf family protein n=1 Tax=Oleiphilus sp. HI0132 TaxID=1822270 RepID=UPI0007C38DAA|nr:Maf family protein [Oleiphilus sp. HI0132]KZY95121.1 hypothetical protein A3743_24130 [Oleiphilus sp. HI0072]KZZ06495.1 hypothetical protein A3749_02570 [Oleiphilus sp. HI0078]KZZ28590.1 hypothetical protein A3752_03750 [Oleiphilus sp. HI0081]KZY97474.1 hypothetical protein A3743_00400 [Oleiphilus sp. HI0072]KZZ71658.1 hypothetical protein A3766_08030 [Oleiphilus sp. HI0132]